MVGSRAFPVAAAKIWNALPDSLVSMTSPQTLAPFEDISVSAFFFLALQWTWQ